MRNKDFALQRDENGNIIALNKPGNSLFNRIYTAILIRHGTLVSNPQYGSNLHQVNKATTQAETLIITHVKDALKPLSNIISNVQVLNVNVHTATGWANFTVKCESSGQTHNFEYWIKL